MCGRLVCIKAWPVIVNQETIWMRPHMLTSEALAVFLLNRSRINVVDVSGSRDQHITRISSAVQLDGLLPTADSIDGRLTQ